MRAAADPGPANMSRSGHASAGEGGGHCYFSSVLLSWGGLSFVPWGGVACSMCRPCLEGHSNEVTAVLPKVRSDTVSTL